MRAALPLALFATALSVSAQTLPPAPPPAPPPWPPASAAECAVFAREASFADSVERADEAAFAEHVHPGAVFLGGAVPARGRAEVVSQWRPIIRSEGITLRWRAGNVVIGSDPDIAYSTGPSYIERGAPSDGVVSTRPRFVLMTYFSVWVRDAGPTWRVIYDGGAVLRETDDATAVERHLASGRTRCPSQ